MRRLKKRKQLGGDFICLTQMQNVMLKTILKSAKEMKASRKREQFLNGKILAMIFDKPSTRTRVSFDVAMRQLGGSITALSAHDMQLGRGETIADTARVLSRYVDIIMLRTTAEEHLLELAEIASVPVINGLTDESHPCQIMADIMTFQEHRGSIQSKKIAWLGDGNNVSASLAHATAHFDFELHVAIPKNRTKPVEKAARWAKQWTGKEKVIFHENASAAGQGAHAIITDTWVSMGEEADKAELHQLFKPYQVNQKLMQIAHPDAVFMHCLPAHRGEEVTAEVLEGPQSIVWDEAENRLHVQKSILLWCLGGKRGLLLPWRVF